MAEKKVYHGNLPKTCIKEQELGPILRGSPFAKYELFRTEEYEEQFWAWLRACGFDSYGEWHDPRLSEFLDEKLRFNNGTFALFPYYWGDDPELCSIPNFVYFPENIQIFWYKYPLRDAMISENLSPEEFREMLKKCSDSLEYSLRSAQKEKR